jgi:CRP-like cAMP-binding protein
VRNLEASPFTKLVSSEQTFTTGQVLGRPGSPIDAIFVVKEGLLSVTVPLSHGGEVETAMIGPRGVAGAMVGFGCTHWLNPIVARTSGSVSVIERSEFVVSVRESQELKQKAFRQELWISVQAQQAAACNASHPLAARLSTWLLRAQDLTGWKEFPFTHESISEMLGAQRVSISNTEHDLKQKGLIENSRARVSIEDRDGLRKHACECYETMRSAYEMVAAH